MVHSLLGDTDFFETVAGVLEGDTLTPFSFILCLKHVLRTSIDLTKENVFTLKKARRRIYPTETITDTDYADEINRSLYIPR